MATYKAEFLSHYYEEPMHLADALYLALRAGIRPVAVERRTLRPARSRLPLAAAALAGIGVALGAMALRRRA